MKSLLLIEDEEVIRRALKRFLERKQFLVTDVATVEEAKLTSLTSFDVVLADLRLPGAPGTTIIDAIAPTPVVVMTSHASVRSAVDVMQEGATDYIAKPFDHDELLLVLERAMQRDRLGIRVAALERDLARLIPASRRVDKTSLESLAASINDSMGDTALTSGLRCFLNGPPGCGREGIARAVHARGARPDGPFVVANLASMSEQHLQSIGRLDVAPDVPGLRAARHGTLVIRRPGLLPVHAQQELASNLQPGQTDLVCIADRSIEKLLEDGLITPEFGALFDTHQQHQVPPLKERPDDVLVHARRVIETTSNRCGRPPPELAEAACSWLRSQDWPGEVLELEALVARATVLITTKQLTLADLAGASAATGTALNLDGYFRWFVQFHQSSLSETELAARLGISRKALWERRQRSGLLRPSE